LSDINKIIDSLAGDCELVFKYFAFFSRFEYSLKRTGFIKTNTKAEANWDTFANSVQGKFASVQDNEFKDAIDFLQNTPPRTQIVSNNNLSWTDTLQGNGESCERYILRLVSTIRNNLFHGGKYPIGPVEDIARNNRLLSAGLTVLERCLDLNQQVKAIFEDMA
jgi:hypothetical protein